MNYRRVRRRVNLPFMLQELSDASVDKWNNIPMCKINQQLLIGSMESRIQKGVNAREGHTHF